MKNIVIIILVLLSPTIFAQDTTFFDKSFRKVSSINQCNTYQICTRNEVDTNKALLETFYKSGQIKSRSATLFIDNHIPTLSFLPLFPEEIMN